MKSWGFILLFLFLFLELSLAQTNRISKLQENIYQAKNESDKLNAIFLLLEEHQSMNRDSLDYYAYLAVDMASKTRKPLLISKANIGLAADYYRWGWMDSLLLLTSNAIKENTVENETTRDLYFKFSRFKAFAFAGRSRYEEALDVFYEIIRKAELYGDTLTLCLNYNSIGSVMLLRAQPAQGFEWAAKAFAFTNGGKRYIAEAAASLANMGHAYEGMGKYDSAEHYLEKGLALARQIENLNIQATILRFQSQIRIRKKTYASAETILKEMWLIRKSLVSETQFADDGLLLVDFYMETEQWAKAIAYCERALMNVEEANAQQIYSHITSENVRKDYYQALAKCYKATGNQKAYIETLEKLIGANETYYKQNSEKAMAEMEVKYESEKQAGKIKELENDQLRQKAGKQNLLRNFLILVFVLAAALLGYVLFTNRKLKKHNEELNRKNREIALATTKGQSMERKRVANELHDNLNTKLAALRWRLEALGAMQDGFTEKNALPAIIEMLDDVYDDVRLISHNMLPEELASKGLQVALYKLFDKLNVNPKTNFKLVLENQAERFNPKVEFELYQVVLEMVNNILKHAQASNVWLSLSHNNQIISLSVSDDGVGFDSAKISDGIGLRNIQARIATLMGTCKIESKPGMGTKFMVEVPA